MIGVLVIVRNSFIRRSEKNLQSAAIYLSKKSRHLEIDENEVEVMKLLVKERW